MLGELVHLGLAGLIDEERVVLPLCGCDGPVPHVFLCGLEGIACQNYLRLLRLTLWQQVDLAHVVTDELLRLSDFACGLVDRTVFLDDEV